MKFSTYPNILVVDDNQNNNYSISKLLESLPVISECVYSGEEALKKLTDKRFDLLLLDVQMPIMDGFEVAHLINCNHETNSIPIIFMTAINKEEDYIRKGYELGAIDYIFKPINPVEFKKKINEFINNFRAKNRLKNLEKKYKRIEKVKQILHHRTSHDNLTGLLNRTSFEERLNETIKIWEKQNRKIALLIVNIDGFKKFNNYYGYQIGDEILVQVGQRIKNTVPETHCAARIGADEFIIYMQNISHEEEAANMAQLIMESLTEPLKLKKGECFVSVSIGITIYPNDGKHIAELYKNLQLTKQRAKQYGKNNFQFFNKNIQRNTINSVQLYNSLCKAVKHENFIVHYQPIIDIHDKNRIYAVEALLRWSINGKQFIPPGKFIPLAEENGLINLIGNCALNKTCEQIRKWNKEGINLNYISINVSAYQLRSPRFVNDILQILKEHQIPTSNIQLELTENVFIGNDMAILTVLNDLKRAGFLLAIDDYGTGYSCLSYLQKMPIDTLKIDKEFFSTLKSFREKAVLKSIIDLAYNLKLNLIAEGVETEEQLNIFSELGGHLVQGYFFAKPLSDEILKQEFLNY